MKKILAILLAAVALVSCTGNKTSSSEESTKPKALILYYSQEGSTKHVAETLRDMLEADIEAIELEDPYSGSYDETIERCKKEMESGEVPAVKPLKADLSKYDVVFLGYPIWFGTYARPIAGLVKNESFKGKKVITFCTFGSGGLQSSTADLKKALPDAEVVEGYGVRAARLQSLYIELERFLAEQGFHGSIKPLPEFPEQHPVSDEEKSIFEQACGDYKFPLGTPVTAAKREGILGTEYLYFVDSKDADGNPAKAKIYVTVPVGKGIDDKELKPEFTQVIRL